MNRKFGLSLRKLAAATALAAAPCAASSAVPGLLAEYFDFVDTPLSGIPDLSGLVPDAVLVASNVDYSVTKGAWPGLDAARFTDRFAARFTGYVDIPADGAYTFALTSDDGSSLWIDGVPVVDHGGAHSLSRKAGAATLAAGRHGLSLLYFDATGKAGLTLSWSGPGFAEETVPASVLSHDPLAAPIRPSVKIPFWTGAGFARAGLPAPLECIAWDGDAPAPAAFYLAAGIPVPESLAEEPPFAAEWTPPGTGTYSIAAVALSGDGLCATSAPVSVAAVLPPEGYGWGLEAGYFNTDGESPSDIPDLRGRLPGFVRMEDSACIPDLRQGLPGWSASGFAARFTGWFAVREAGEYTITLASDDGARLWLDGVLCIDNGGVHSFREKSGTLVLPAGLHRLRIEYLDVGGASRLELYWKLAGFPRGPVPASSFLHSETPSADSDGDGMPDAWEIDWGLDPDDPSDAHGDADGDGLDNLREYALGTSPMGFTLAPEISADGLLGEFVSLGDSDPDSVSVLEGMPPDLLMPCAPVDFPKTRGVWDGLPADGFSGAFGARLSGYLRVPATGWYTLALRSDDGSRLALDGETAIDYDGLHGSHERSATFWLEAGDHPLLLEYFDAGKDRELALSWSGPGFAKETVPAANLVRMRGAVAPAVALTAPLDGAVFGAGNDVPFAASAASPDGEAASVELLLDGLPLASAPGGEVSAVWTNAAAGEHSAAAVVHDLFGNCRTSRTVRVTVDPPPAAYVYGAASRFYAFPTNLAAIPPTDRLAADLSRVDTVLDFPPATNAWTGLPDAMTNYFSSVHEGLLWVRESGDYTLALRSDDGSRLALDGEAVIDHGGLHSLSKRSCSVRLLAGCHPFRLEYFENEGSAALSFLWKGADFAERPVEPTALLRQTGNPDTDGDGMPDWWEAMHGLDPLVPAPPDADFDGDGIPDIDEFLVVGTRPEDKDTDGDGLPDKWEADNGTDPLVWDRLGDPDGDGLCNFDEFLAGTSPLTPDTDGDGLPDGDEVNGMGTDPLTPEAVALPETAAVSAAPAGIVSMSSACRLFGTDMKIRRRGRASFRLDVPNPGIYAEALRVRVSPGETAVPPAFTAWVDGVFLGRRNSPPDGEGTVTWYTPFLNQGAHTFTVSFEGFAFDASCVLASLDLLAGEDPSQWTGWSRSLVSSRSGITSHADGVSHVSPACVEGRSLHPATCSAASGGTPVAMLQTGERSWCADLPLDAGAATLDVAFENGGSSASRMIRWEPLEAFAAPGRVAVRTGDTLRLAVRPGGAAPDAPAAVSVDGVSVWTGTSAGFAELSFAEAGERTVGVSCNGLTRSLTLAVYARFTPPYTPVCIPGQPRAWTVTVPRSPLPSLSEDAYLEASWLPGGVNLSLYTAWSAQRLAFRAGPGGPVLGVAAVEPFWMAATPSSYLIKTERPEEGGYDVRQGDLVVRGMREGIEIEIAGWSGGILLDDFLRSRTVGAGDFDADGVYLYRLIHPDSTSAEACHTVTARQEGEAVGKAWYNGEEAAGGTER